nr:hypothetical protein [Tanacetum cinerariifolium]
MLVAQEVGEDADKVHVEDVNAAGVATKGVVSAADDVVSTAVVEPSMPSPTPPTPPPQQTQDQPLTSQVHLTPPPLPQVQPQSPQHQSQPLEITKLKSKVKKLERRNKASKLNRLKKVGTAQRIDTSDDTVMDDVSKQGGIIENIDADEDVVLEDAKDVADVKEIANDQGRKMDEEDNRALKRMNESQEDNALKKQKLNEEVEELKIHLQIMLINEEDVYTKAIPLALKVHVVDYELTKEQIYEEDSRALKRMNESQEDKALKKAEVG